MSPAPVSTQAPIPVSSRAARSAAAASPASAVVNRLPCSGRFSVNTATRPWRVTASAVIGSSTEAFGALGDIRKADEVVELLERSQLIGNRVRRATLAHEGLHHVLHCLVHCEHRLDGAERVVETELVNFFEREIRAL